MTRFVERFGGFVVNHFANFQAGYAEEELPDDHDDLIAWVSAQSGSAERYSWGDPLIEFVRVGVANPGVFFTKGGYTTSRVGNVITITRLWVPWTQVEIDAYMAGQRDLAVAVLSNIEDVGHALVSLIRKEFNRHAAWHRAQVMAINGAGTYAAMKTALQATVTAQGLTPIPNRTPANIRAGIRAELGRDDGDA